MSKKNRVVLDFDGVIHSDTSGWRGITVCNDPPVDGIANAISDIRKAGYEVAVVSSRTKNWRGKRAIRKYLKKHEIEVDLICKEKPPARVYVDDRALRFDGDASTLLGEIANFEPYWKR